MFNGIIFNQGVIKKITRRDKGINVFINSNLKLTKKDIGVSVASDGVCLTLITIKNKLMEFYLSDETIQRSKFKFLKINDKINLELPLKYGQKFQVIYARAMLTRLARYSISKKLISPIYLILRWLKKKEKT